MKRSMEGEHSECPQPKILRLPEGNAELLSSAKGAEALSFIIIVKEHFKDDQNKYTEFIHIMHNFLSKKYDTVEIITRLKDLFKGHSHLVLSFNNFLPKGFEILFPSKEFLPKEQEVEFNEAIKYIKKIKTRFQNEQHVYKSFMLILDMYRKGNKSINDIYQKVKSLFYDHKDLVEEFTHFLPVSTSTAIVPHLQASARLSMEPTFELTSVRHSHKENMVKRQPSVISNNNCCQSSQCALIKYDKRTSVAIENEYSKKAEKEKDLKEGWELKEEDRVEIRPARNKKGELNIMNQHPYRRNLTRRSDDLIPRQRQMGRIDGSTGKHFQHGPPVNHSKTLSINPQEMDFFEKVKTKIGNNTCRELMKCIDMHSKKLIGPEHLKFLADRILGKYPDIKDEFNELVSQSGTGNTELALGEEEFTQHTKTGKGAEKERNLDRLLEKENEENKEKDNEEDRDGHKDQYHRLRVMLDRSASPLLTSKKLTYKPLPEMALSDCERCIPSYHLLPQNFQKPVADLAFGEEECTKHVKTGKGTKKERDLDRVLEKENERNKEIFYEEDRDGHKDQHHRSIVMLDSNASPLSNNEKLTYKPISEMDLSDRERCTPSYRLLPQNFLKPVSSYGTDLAAEVLNDICVAVASGSEDYPKHLQENCYEEAIFRCEEDRFELDVLIESTGTTIKRVHKLLEKMHDNTTKSSGHFQIEDHLTAINLRCIERIYGDHGLDIILELHDTPGRCLPVIVKRLQQKHDEWSNCRTKLNKCWADVYANNYKKSLDHRSSYFKQKDRNSLSKKALLQDIKEISERKSKEDGMLLAITFGNSTPLIPHLKYKYPDMALHEDLYKIIKYSSDKVCTATKDSDKIMKICTIFFEHMFGFFPQSNGAEDTKEELRLALESNWKLPGVERENGVIRCKADTLNSRCSCHEHGHGELGIEREEGELSPCSYYEVARGELDGEREGKLSLRLVMECHKDNEGTEENESEVGEMANEHTGDLLSLSNGFLLMAKPLTQHIYSTSARNTSENNTVFYGNDAFYVFFRLYQALYEQILSTKRNALAAEQKWNVKDRLPRKLDKLTSKVVEQLKTIALGEMEKGLLKLGLYERWRSPSTFSDVVYHANTSKLLKGKNVYRFEFASHSAELSIQLMGKAPGKLDHDAKELEPAFTDYLQNDLFSTVFDAKERRGIFLSRNMRKFTRVDDYFSMSNVMKGITLVNGLVLIISCETSKARYVNGTEDFLFRKKPKKQRVAAKLS